MTVYFCPCCNSTPSHGPESLLAAALLDLLFVRCGLQPALLGLLGETPALLGLVGGSDAPGVLLGEAVALSGRLLLAVFVRLKSSSNAKVCGLEGTALQQGISGSQQPRCGSAGWVKHGLSY